MHQELPKFLVPLCNNFWSLPNKASFVNVVWINEGGTPSIILTVLIFCVMMLNAEESFLKHE